MMKLAVFTKNRTNPAYEAARIGADRTANRFGAAITHYVPDIPDDVDQQIALIDRAIAARPDAAVFVPAHETKVNDAILRFGAAGVPLFNFITRTTAGDRKCFVGSDDRALAIAITRYLCRRLSGRGDIVILEGTAASATSRERLEGFRAALADYPEIRVRASLPGEYQRHVAREVFGAAGEAVRGIDAVLCANDVMALGVLDTFGANDPRPLVVGVNAIPEAIKAIADGQMLATANFDAMSMCSLATEAAIRHLRGETVPREIALPVTVVDAANCAAWNLPFDARKTPDWDHVTERAKGMSRAYICTACGMQYPPGDAAPKACTICDDERQYVPPAGQSWTTLDALAARHFNVFREHEPGIIGIGAQPAFAIGQRALLIRTPQGNVLWDCIAMLDKATVELIKGLGGLTAIAISHPHFYTTMVEWSRAFGDVPIHLHAADREWVMRPDKAVKHWDGETLQLLPDVTLVRGGGHFPGGTMLHWAKGAGGRGVVCSADIATITTDRKYLTFMKSYPNFIPLSEREVRGIAAALAPFAYDTMYGHFFDRVIATGAKRAMEVSVERYVKAIRG